ncbi:hypothetical protein DRN97_06275, partial [Methanosarcinales archaeon]
MHEKERINEYADSWYLAWFEDRIKYIQYVAEQLEGCLSVYQELIEEAEVETRKCNSRGGFGWIPTEKFITHMDEAIKLLDMAFCGVLTHQQSLISAKLAYEQINSNQN